tara:strand:- start:1496 stop:1918 length:423 start_codon:yes stop_codon:yes gene_type:complete
MKITNKQKQLAEKIVKKYDLDFVVAFGSRINGKARQDSDLDIAVMGHKNNGSYKKYGSLFNEFSKIFPEFNIDLRLIQGSEPVFLYNVFLKGKFLAGDLQKFYSYKAFAYKNYIDSQSFFALKHKLLHKRQQEITKLIHD